MAAACSSNSNSCLHFSKILVAVDGSEESLKAANLAILLAEKDNAELLVLTVNYIPSIFDITSSTSSSTLKQHKEDRIVSKKWFDEIRKSAQQSSGGVQVRTELVDSPMPVQATIVEYAERENVDLIVVGTRGRSGLKKLLLGSVASAVVAYATRPVLVAK